MPSQTRFLLRDRRRWDLRSLRTYDQSHRDYSKSELHPGACPVQGSIEHIRRRIWHITKQTKVEKNDRRATKIIRDGKCEAESLD